MPGSPEREYYRIDYPPNERPRLRAGGLSMPVLECSERGMRYDVSAEPLPAVGDTVSGAVTFRNEARVDIVGTVVRVQAPTVVLRLEPPGLPYAILIAEQRFIMKHYPGKLKRRPSPP